MGGFIAEMAAYSDYSFPITMVGEKKVLDDVKQILL